MFAQIKWNTYAVGWSLGYCAACEQAQPIRLEEQIETVSLVAVQVSKSVNKRSAYCDFCDQPAAPWEGACMADIHAWNPQQGMAALASLLGITNLAENASAPTDARLRSFLSELESKLTWRRINFLGGLFFGGALGAIGGGYGTVLVQYLFPDQVSDSLDYPVLIGGALGVLGLLGGSFLNLQLARNQIAAKSISRICNDYGVAPNQLTLLAANHSWPIRRAIRRQRDRA